ncbi:SDR family NAD(P)-dependent oxidoreductase [Pelagovum pacificum]|uniref:SDR family oxidoreductase n=1 Tax=Pelagovum pacificum TaxID=2588711 RepID=A0A5C5GBV3_9RHOB|nr:SDR family oxidoreductase [Pelagovum pacificum]QQA42381.1 SDR family oxidoreductase [Pelagovum pacificum]TNY31464.1 SDR family oxidoreductase [Pelagovum pacificum]
MPSHSATFADLRDASVFITGGGSGIGAALTEGFLRQGAKVAFIGRSDYSDFCDKMEQKTGVRPLFVKGDVTDTARLRAAIDEAEAAHGPLDVLVNNAANDQRTDPMEVSVEDWDSMMAINFRHYFFACQRAAESMKGRGGSIVNFSSIAHVMGVDELNVYGPANAGIEGMTRTLSRNWGKDGIRVNSLLPGMVLTEAQLEKWISEEDRKKHLEGQALKRSLYPEDIVGPVLFLASDASGAITGQGLIVDGGYV